MSIKKSQQTLFTFPHYILNVSLDMVSINHMIDAKWKRICGAKMFRQLSEALTN